MLIYTFIAYMLRALAAEVTRVTLEVGSQGKLGGQVHVEGVWLNLVRNVSFFLPCLMQWQLNLRQLKVHRMYSLL